MSLKLVGISGSPRSPSRTAEVVRLILRALEEQLECDSKLIALSDVLPVVFSAGLRAGLVPPGEAVIRTIETADVLVVGSPVYRASYTGVLKHVFDLVSHTALVGKPTVLAATGGSAMHGLVNDHQLRPLLSFFGALTVPTTIYATEADFEDGRLVTRSVEERIARAAAEAARLTPRPRVRRSSETPARLVANA